MHTCVSLVPILQSCYICCFLFAHLCLRHHLFIFIDATTKLSISFRQHFCLKAFSFNILSVIGFLEIKHDVHVFVEHLMLRIKTIKHDIFVPLRYSFLLRDLSLSLLNLGWLMKLKRNAIVRLTSLVKSLIPRVYILRSMVCLLLRWNIMIWTGFC